MPHEFSPEKLEKFAKREEALEKLKEDLARGLSVSDEEFEKEKEETMEELGAKKGKDYEKVKGISRKKKRDQEEGNEEIIH